MATAQLSSKGQLTIPQEVRQALNLHTGDRVEFVAQAEGGYLLQAKKVGVADLIGLLGPTCAAALSPQDMDAAIEAAIQRDHLA